MFPIEVVELVLHHSGQIALHAFIVLFKVFVHVLHSDDLSPSHRLVYARQAEASFFHRAAVSFFLYDVRVYVCLSESFVFGHVFREHIEVYHDHSDGESHLRCGQAYAVRFCHCFKHVGYQFFQLRIIGCYVFCCFS